MARYDLTEQAVGDLKDIARYTKREWGIEQARHYREELELSLEKLSLSPNIGRNREEVAPGVRSFRVAAHIAFYIQRRGGITILRLLHPSRDIDLAFADPHALEKLLKARVDAATKGGISGKSVDEIADDVLKPKKPRR